MILSIFTGIAKSQSWQNHVELPQDKIDLSVIIVSYNNLDLISACLKSIQKYNDIGERLEVIVIEQSPTEEVFQGIVSDFPWVTCVRNENQGFGAGNNRGHEHSLGKYLLFLNPDTLLTENIFSFAVETFEADQNLGMFGVRLIHEDGTNCQSFYFRDTIGLFRSIFWIPLDKWNIFLPRTMFITGADMFVRREAFEKADRFDERFFMYLEEADLSNRMNACGYTLAYFPEKKIIHLEGRSSDSSKTVQRTLDTMRIYYAKYGISFSRKIKKWIRWEKVRRIFLSDKDDIDRRIAILREQLD